MCAYAGIVDDDTGIVYQHINPLGLKISAAFSSIASNPITYHIDKIWEKKKDTPIHYKYQ